MQFNFNFGKKKPTIIQYAIIGVVLSSLIGGLSQCTHIQEDDFWYLLDQIQRRFFPQSPINDFIISDPKLLNRRIKGDVDDAIRQVTSEYDRIIKEANKKFQPRYEDLPNDESVCYTDKCKALAPPMRICAPWVDNCLKD
jgi:hypothetical protein